LSFFLFSLFSHQSPYTVSNSFQLLLSVALSLHYTPTLSRSRKAIPHRNVGFARLLSPYAFWASALFASFCQPTPHQFHFKTVLISNLHSQFINSSLISSPNSHDSSNQVVFAILDILLFLCLCHRL